RVPGSRKIRTQVESFICERKPKTIHELWHLWIPHHDFVPLVHEAVAIYIPIFNITGAYRSKRLHRTVGNIILVLKKAKRNKRQTGAQRMAMKRLVFRLIDRLISKDHEAACKRNVSLYRVEK